MAAADTITAVGTSLPSAQRITRKNANPRFTSADPRKARNLATTKRASVPAICRRSPITQASTNTRKLSPRARASRKRATSRSAEAEINQEEIYGKEHDQSRARGVRTQRQNLFRILCKRKYSRQTRQGRHQTAR